MTGVLVDPRDLEGFAQAVVRLLGDSSAAKVMGDLAGERVRDGFLGPRHLTQYVELFARLLQPQTSPV